MIHVERQSVPVPSFLDSDEADKLRKSTAEFYRTPQVSRRQRRFYFASMGKSPGVRDSLDRLFHYKCAYCENLITTENPGNIDTFRPKNGVVDLDGIIYPDHYWWLAYEWENLYLTCEICNQRKGSRFPIRKKRAAPGDRGEALLREDALLLDPCVDYPEEHLVFDESGVVTSATEKGSTTIQILDLNRSSTVNSRAETYRSLASAWQSLLASEKDPARLNERSQMLHDLVDPTKPFAAMRRQFVGQWLRSQPDTLLDMISPDWRSILEELTQRHGVVSNARRAQVYKTYNSAAQELESFTINKTEVKQDRQRFFTRTRLIERIVLNNFRIHRDLEITLSQGQGGQIPWCMLLGENGSGKSSVLHAVALTLAGNEYRSQIGIKPDDVLRYRCRSGSVKVFFSGVTEPIELSFRRGEPDFESSDVGPKSLLLGYGATRLLPLGNAQPAEGTSYARLENLFNPHVPLQDATKWLLSLRSSVFDRVALALKELLSLEDKEKLVRRVGADGEILVQTYDARVPLDQLSAGYQSVLAMTIDIMSIMLKQWARMEDAEGIVLIDELEAHLHPRWKMRIVSSLRAAFPRIQFLATTHDPLALRGLKTGEVTLLRRSGDSVVAVADLPSLEGLRVDQLLTSEYFGLNSTVDPEVEALYQEYYALLAKSERSKDEDSRLADLKAELDSHRQFGTTRRERMALEAADAYLAEESSNPDPERLQNLKQSTVQRLREIWKQKPVESGS